jgi:stress response protein SCP2
MDADTGSVIQTYRLDQFKNETALMIGSLHRTSSGWSFEPVGSASTSEPNKVAGFYL